MKRRPALVVSSDTYHRHRPDVIVGLITSQITSTFGPTDYVLQDWRAAGLLKASAFRAYLLTVSTSDIGALIGKVSDQDRLEIMNCVRTAIA